MWSEWWPRRERIDSLNIATRMNRLDGVRIMSVTNMAVSHASLLATRMVTLTRMNRLAGVYYENDVQRLQSSESGFFGKWQKSNWSHFPVGGGTFPWRIHRWKRNPLLLSSSRQSREKCKLVPKRSTRLMSRFTTVSSRESTVVLWSVINTIGHN